MDIQFSRGGRIRAWIEIVRIPNLFLVPGDPVVGYLLTCPSGPLGPLALAASISLLLYSAGLISNDACDVGTDRRERPTRPIPRGAVRPGTAFAVAGALAGAALLLASLGGLRLLGSAGSLLLLIALYNAGGKSVPIWGPLNMGLCRGMSVVVGATAAGEDFSLNGPSGIAASAIALYVAAVTAVASVEMRLERAKARRWLPLVAVTAAWVAGAALVGSKGEIGLSLLFMGAAAASTLWTWLAGVRLNAESESAPTVIGHLLRGLLLIQAGLALPAGLRGLIAAGLLIAAWPVVSDLSRRFHPS